MAAARMDDGTNGRRRRTTAKEPWFAVFPSAALLALHCRRPGVQGNMLNE